MNPLKDPLADQFRISHPTRLGYRAKRPGVIDFEVERNVSIGFIDAINQKSSLPTSTTHQSRAKPRGRFQ